jgi:hypothetical protein
MSPRDNLSDTALSRNTSVIVDTVLKEVAERYKHNVGGYVPLHVRSFHHQLFNEEAYGIDCWQEDDSPWSTVHFYELLLFDSHGQLLFVASPIENTWLRTRIAHCDIYLLSLQETLRHYEVRRQLKRRVTCVAIARVESSSKQSLSSYIDTVWVYPLPQESNLLLMEQSYAGTHIGKLRAI